MAFNEGLADRIRRELPHEELPFFTEKKMFGGLAFMYKNKMCVGVVKDDLMVRVTEAKMATCLAKPFVREMDFTNRPMKEFVFVSSEGCADSKSMQQWIALGIEHAQCNIKN
ncbi:MAG: TfoX/Sxy family protein [Marinoscillum sp.]